MASIRFDWKLRKVRKGYPPRPGPLSVLSPLEGVKMASKLGYPVLLPAITAADLEVRRLTVTRDGAEEVVEIRKNEDGTFPQIYELVVDQETDVDAFLVDVDESGNESKASSTLTFRSTDETAPDQPGELRLAGPPRIIPDDVSPTPEPAPEPGPDEPVPAPEPAPDEPIPAPEPAPAPAPDEPVPAPAPDEPVPTPDEPVPTPEPAPEPGPDVTPTPEPAPEPAPDVTPAVNPTPVPGPAPAPDEGPLPDLPPTSPDEPSQAPRRAPTPPTPPRTPPRGGTAPRR
jgi:hypothetical protein